MSWRTALLAGLLVVAGCGRGGGVVVYGFGETIDHPASFDEATASLVSEQFDFVEPAVGLHYEYLSLFFLDVWTSDGDVVFYDRSEDIYADAPAELLLEYTGRSADEFDVPFFFRFPPGALLLVAAIVAFVLVTWQRMRAFRPGATSRN